VVSDQWVTRSKQNAGVHLLAEAQLGRLDKTWLGDWCRGYRDAVDYFLSTLVPILL